MNNLSEHFSKLAELQYFDHKAFQADDTVSNEVCGFILSLALIYNDLKNIILFTELLKSSKPEGSFVERKDWGEYYGLDNFLARSSIAILHELFGLIRNNKSVLEDKFFKQIIKNIRKGAKISWQILVDTSFEKYSNNKLSKDLMLIRNKIASHYDPKAIKLGYDFFYKQIKIMDKAYISRGKNMPESRFYFADAAGESYIKYLYGSDDTRLFYSSIDNYLQQLNNTIWYIINNFIAKRGFGFRSK
jgi:hypothetical protein